MGNLSARYPRDGHFSQGLARDAGVAVVKRFGPGSGRSTRPGSPKGMARMPPYFCLHYVLNRRKSEFTVGAEKLTRLQCSLLEHPALAIILQGNGSHFAPALIEAFVACADDFRAISREFADE